MHAGDYQPAYCQCKGWSHEGVHYIVDQLVVPVKLLDPVHKVEDSSQYSSGECPEETYRKLKINYY